jgi:hypothetical protein
MRHTGAAAGTANMTHPTTAGPPTMTQRPPTRPRLVNLTPHPVELTDADGRLLLVLPPAARATRVTVSRRLETELDLDGVRVPVWRSVAARVEGLPPQEPNTWLVVARLVADTVARAGVHRTDLLVPDDLVRDTGGRVTGCRGFSLA